MSQESKFPRFGGLALNLKTIKSDHTMAKQEKECYIAPRIERVVLDNEISLQLESTPPPAPGETKLNTPEYFNNDPFKTNQA